MERFLSPGYRLRPLEAPESTKKVGRPPRQVPGGALVLGEKVLKRCGSRKKLEDEQRIASMERKIEAPPNINKNQYTLMNLLKGYKMLATCCSKCGTIKR